MRGTVKTLPTIKLNPQNRAKLVHCGLHNLAAGNAWLINTNYKLNDYGKRTNRAVAQSTYDVLKKYQQRQDLTLQSIDLNLIKKALGDLLESEAAYRQRHFLNSPNVWSYFFVLAQWLSLKLTQLEIPNCINKRFLEEAESFCMQACLDHPIQLLADWDELEKLYKTISSETEKVNQINKRKKYRHIQILIEYRKQLQKIRSDIEQEINRIQKGLQSMNQSVFRKDQTTPVSRTKVLLNQSGLGLGIDLVSQKCNQEENRFLQQYNQLHELIFKRVPTQFNVETYITVSQRLTIVDHIGQFELLPLDSKKHAQELGKAYQALQSLKVLYEHQAFPIAQLHRESARQYKFFQHYLISYKNDCGKVIAQNEAKWSYQLFPWAYKKTKASIQHHMANLTNLRNNANEIHEKIQRLYTFSVVAQPEEVDNMIKLLETQMQLFEKTINTGMKNVIALTNQMDQDYKDYTESKRQKRRAGNPSMSLAQLIVRVRKREKTVQKSCRAAHGTGVETNSDGNQNKIIKQPI